MAKVHPFHDSSATSSYFTSKQETFTIWMKSLILNGKGCTVFDSQGQILYRVDNYNCRTVDEPFLMDQNGTVLFTIRNQKGTQNLTRHLTHSYFGPLILDIKRHLNI